MSSSVINGAIGKSPLIDKMNQLAEKEIQNKTTLQLEQQVLQNNSAKSPSFSISFSGYKEEVKKQIKKRRGELE